MAAINERGCCQACSFPETLIDISCQIKQCKDKSCKTLKEPENTMKMCIVSKKAFIKGACQVGKEKIFEITASLNAAMIFRTLLLP